MPARLLYPNVSRPLHSGDTLAPSLFGQSTAPIDVTPLKNTSAELRRLIDFHPTSIHDNSVQNGTCKSRNRFWLPNPRTQPAALIN